MTDCTHHWIIDTAAGPTSRGVCERCGIEQAFANSLPDDPEGRKRIGLHMSQIRGRGAELAPLRKRFMSQIRGRGAELAPLRKRFAELAREGLTLQDIKDRPGFRDVAYPTLKTWHARYKKQARPAPVNPDAPETVSVCADAPVDPVATDGMNAPLGPPAPQSMPPVLAAMLELIPCPDANRQRHVDWLEAWLAAWRAVYTLLYLAERPRVTPRGLHPRQ